MGEDEQFIVVVDCMVEVVLSNSTIKWSAIYLDDETHFVCPFCNKSEEELGIMQSCDKFDHVTKCYKINTQLYLRKCT